MSTEADQHTHYLPDGSVVTLTVRTTNPAIATIFTTEVAGRLRKASRLFTRADHDRTLSAYRGFAPGGGDEHESTDELDLPSGRVTVSIEASDRSSHGYLRYAVRGAVSYTHVLDVDVGRASLIAGSLLGVGILLGAVGHPFASAPLFGAGGVMALYVAVHWLTARGVPISLSRPPGPTRPYR